MQNSDPKKLVEAMLGDGDEGIDPKQFAMTQELGSDAFREVMGNFEKHMHDLVRKAKASGALSGEEPEYLVLKCLLVIAANDFFSGHIPEFKKTLKNLQHYL